MNTWYLLGACTAVLAYSIVPTYTAKIVHRVHRKRGGKTLYLTFDDGPDLLYTPQLLRLLARYNIKASFFVVAQFAAQNPAIIQRMQDEGHLVGVHGLAHKNGMLQTPWQAYSDFREARQTMQHLGVNVQYFRPPWGHWNVVSACQMCRAGMKLMLWDVMAQDWSASETAKSIETKLLQRTTGGSIICLHDGRGKDDAPARTIAALRKTIPQWLKQGYRFDTVDHYGT